MEYITGLQRIWTEDRFAILITGVLVAFQIVAFWRIWRLTSLPMTRSTDRIRDVVDRVRGGGTPSSDELNAFPPKVKRAWELAFGPGAERGQAVPPDDAFAPSRLLPAEYEPKLDAAAPGLFTALGIGGTFVGLILGFLPMDPGNATASVGPLIGGMVVAFFNSFVGVFLSILWSYRSRRRRHAFDRSCDDLVAATEQRARAHDPAALMLERFEVLTGATLGLHARMDAGLGEIRSGLGVLGDRTAESSRDLLENLAPQIRGAFGTLVNLPFDRLDESVGRFDAIIQTAAVTQERIAREAAASAEIVGRAGEALARVVAAARDSVDGFEGAASVLRSGTEAAAELLEQTRTATEGLAAAASEVHGAAGRHHETAAVLGETTAGLEAVSHALRAQTAHFREASVTLETTVNRIGEIAREGAEEGAAAVRGELQRAVDDMAAALREVGETTVTAYEQSSHRIMNTVNARVTDLTDRLSAELTTLSARLPAEVEALNAAMAQIRTSIHRVTRSMDQAANDLARQTPERLRVYLNELDEAVAHAVGRFSGTLGQWDDKVGEVGELVAEMRRLTAALEHRRTIRLPQVTIPAV